METLNAKQTELVDCNMGLVGMVLKSTTIPQHLSRDDIYQEGCVALCDASRFFDENRGNKFGSYAVACIRNRIHAYIRRNRKLTFFEDVQQVPAHEVGGIEKHIDIDLALENLSERERKAVELLFFQDFTLAEVAQVMGGVSHTTIARLRDKAFGRLKNVI